MRLYYLALSQLDDDNRPICAIMILLLETPVTNCKIRPATCSGIWTAKGRECYHVKIRTSYTVKEALTYKS